MNINKLLIIFYTPGAFNIWQSLRNDYLIGLLINNKPALAIAKAAGKIGFIAWFKK